METVPLQDPAVFPDPHVLGAILGRNFKLWTSFLDVLDARQPPLTAQWNYYKDGKKWLCKVSAKKRTICWVSVWPDHFKATFYLGSKNDQAVKAASITPRLKTAFLKQPAGARFRPLTVEVRNVSAIKDVKELIQLKERLK